MFLKQKRCGRVKGRGCVYGRPQQTYIHKEDASSPTASQESVILTAVVDTVEEPYVVFTDIPGAFMQTDMGDKETTIILLEGKMAELFVKLYPRMYRKFLIYEKGRAVLYADLQKALLWNPKGSKAIL